MVRRLHAIGYVVLRGLRGMGQSPLVQLIAVGTMAVCMVLLATAVLIFQNAQGVVEDWGVDVPITVYMAEDADPELTVGLAERLNELPEVAQAQRITPDVALERLAAGLGGQAVALEGIDAEALPDSVEVQLVDGVEANFAPALAARLGDFEGVEEVAVVGPWAQQAQHLLDTLRLLAIGLGVLVSAACMAIVWSTIRLGVFARRAEIEIFRLVGGTARFVRGPFLVEGVLQGLLGAGLAIGGLYFAFDLARPLLQEGLSLLFAAGAISFFTPVQIAAALAFGAGLGALGSRAAVARYVEV